MVVGDEPKPSPTVGTAVLRLGHQACLRVGGWPPHVRHARTIGGRRRMSSHRPGCRIGIARLPPTRRRVCAV